MTQAAPLRTVVYGSRADGHARVVVELLAPHARLELIGLIDDHVANAGRTIGALGVLGGRGDLALLARQRGIEAIVLGFGAARGRAAVIAAATAAGLSMPVLVHPAASVAASAELAAGVQVLPGAIVGPGARLGRGVLLNSGAIAEHDVRIEDGAVVDPGAVLAGRVRVGAEAEIGSGAVVLPDVAVGARAIVGAGAVVTSDVPADVTAVGVPARPLRR